MEEEKAVSLAKEIIELDIKRDEMLETFMQLAGEQAFQLLRSVQTDNTENLRKHKFFTLDSYHVHLKRVSFV